MKALLILLGFSMSASAGPSVTRELTGAQIRNGAGLLTLPTSTDTLVGRATTDTLTNKTMSGSNNTFSAIGYSSLTLSNSIMNADINASAAIDISKINTLQTALDAKAAKPTFSTKTANYTLTATDNVIQADTTSGAFTITLPTASTVTGQLFRLIKTSSDNNLVTVSGTVSGVVNPTLKQQYDVLELVSDGTNYRSISDSFIFKTVSQSTTTKTPAGASQYHDYSGTTGRMQLGPGTWMIIVNAQFTSSGGSAAYTDVGVSLYSADGADTGTQPAALSSGSGITVLSPHFSATGFLDYRKVTGDFAVVSGLPVIIQASQLVDVYMGTFSAQGDSTKARVDAYGIAVRIR